MGVGEVKNPSSQENTLAHWVLDAKKPPRGFNLADPENVKYPALVRLPRAFSDRSPPSHTLSTLVITAHKQP